MAQRDDQEATPPTVDGGSAHPDRNPDSGMAAPGGGDGRSTEPGHSVLSDVASTIVDVAQPVISVARPLIHGVDQLTSGARRMLDERSGARVRRVRQMGRRPLRNLWEVHPEAHRAAIRELGLQTVPVDMIVGSAVEGPPQRGGDFLPLRERRSQDWRARWQRILKAVDGLANLPPVELIKFGDTYWVVDGHNRVAAALYNGQVAIDAVVDELRLPGVARDRTPISIASALEGSSDLRQAGAGRLTRTSVRPQRLPAARAPDHEHGQSERGTDDDGGSARSDPAG